ncbi:MAG: hypothetical protein N2201_03675 [candidate division WOR-3 bacterium]|nr:hypothetical protein [candidate division WOR-3 bacterium]
MNIIKVPALVKQATSLFDRGDRRLGDLICYPIDYREVKSFGYLKDKLTICRLGGQKGMPVGCRGVCPSATHRLADRLTSRVIRMAFRAVHFEK